MIQLIKLSHHQATAKANSRLVLSTQQDKEQARSSKPFFREACWFVKHSLLVLQFIRWLLNHKILILSLKLRYYHFYELFQSCQEAKILSVIWHH